MPETQITCPSCKGAKKHMVFLDGIKNGRMYGWQEMRDCRTCGGTGSVDESLGLQIAAGKRRRAERLDKRLTAKQEADRIGVPVKDYCDMERGILPFPDEPTTPTSEEAEQTNG